MNIYSPSQKSQNGSVLLAIIIMLPFLILITALYMELSVSNVTLARRGQMQTHAQIAADAGIDQAMQEINQNSSWGGTGSETTLQALTNGTRTTYSVSVVHNSSTEKTVTSIGRSYQGSSASPTSTVKVEAKLRSVTSGSYSIVTGVGGLIMENSSKVLGGDVFINGELSMKNTAQIGLSIDPTKVLVAHQICPNPPNGTYPRVCNSGENGQPISMQNSARIYGDVYANNQTNGGQMTDAGLHVGQDGDTDANNVVEPQPLPVHDRDGQKAAVAHNITGAQASCSGSQTKTWEANTKITGDVELQNTCSVTIKGNVWITGNLIVKNSATMVVADALGTTRPDVMVDGSNGASIQNSGLLNINAANTGFQLITYWSAASCSPDCTSVSGSDLYNSRNRVTISLKNSAAGANTIFYSHWSRVEVENTGSIGALVGQTIYLKNSGTITFGTSVGTGTSYWVIDSLQRKF